jgi:hypothetical protein
MLQVDERLALAREPSGSRMASEGFGMQEGTSCGLIFNDQNVDNKRDNDLRPRRVPTLTSSHFR